MLVIRLRKLINSPHSTVSVAGKIIFLIGSHFLSFVVGHTNVFLKSRQHPSSICSLQIILCLIPLGCCMPMADTSPCVDARDHDINRPSAFPVQILLVGLDPILLEGRV